MIENLAVLCIASQAETAYPDAAYSGVSGGSGTDHDNPRPIDQLVPPQFSNVDHVVLPRCGTLVIHHLGR